jgi:hypothetical protein
MRIDNIQSASPIGRPKIEDSSELLSCIGIEMA